MTTAADTEEILVLYGSQTGNSELAAEQICAAIPTKLLQQQQFGSEEKKKKKKCCTARLMHLDDFLELECGRWTRLVIIVCSSYGVGQAPIGARKFREFCDEILTRRRGVTDSDGGGGAGGAVTRGVKETTTKCPRNVATEYQ